MIVLVALNIPMNYMYTRYKSLATRYAETGLRRALVRKLQQLSISYHKETQSTSAIQDYARCRSGGNTVNTDVS